MAEAVFISTLQMGRTEAQRQSDLPKLLQGISGRAGKELGSLDSQVGV